MPGCSCALDRPARSRAGSLSLLGEQHRVAGLRRPGRGRHRERRVVAGRDQRRSAEGCAGDLGLEARRSRPRARTGPGRDTDVVRRSLGARASPTRTPARRRRPAIPVGAGCRGPRGGVRDVVAVGRAGRAPAAAAPSAPRRRCRLASRPRPRGSTALGPRARSTGPGRPRSRRAGGIRDRVLAADPGRVLGGERREAEHGLLRGLLARAGPPPRSARPSPQPAADGGRAAATSAAAVAEGRGIWSAERHRGGHDSGCSGPHEPHRAAARGTDFRRYPAAEGVQWTLVDWSVNRRTACPTRIRPRGGRKARSPSMDFRLSDETLEWQRVLPQVRA